MTTWIYCRSEGLSRLRGDLRLSIDGPIPTAHSNGFGARKYDQWWIVRDAIPDAAPAPVEKPPYRIPLMAEIAALEPNGLTVVSTFSGCGGSCLGFRMAGYRTLYASEFVPAAADTYEANHPGVPLDRRDIREVTGADVRRMAGLGPDDVIDVLEGSPPCASFSTAGKRAAHWGEVKKYSDTSQRTDDLFFEYARLLGELQPRAFVAENVSGLVKGVAKGYFKRIHAALAACGYRVEAKLLDAQWLGVPQARQRVIFVGIRNDLGLAPVFPTPLPYRYSIRDALPWLDGPIVGGNYANFDQRGAEIPADAPAPTIAAGSKGGGSHQFEVVEPTALRLRYRPGGAPPRDRDLSLDGPAPAVSADGIGTAFRSEYELVGEPVPELGAAIGAEWDKLQPGETSDRYFNLVRPNPDAPVATVTQAGGNLGLASVTHPFERRKFTIAELRRLCGFPDDFALTGSYAQQWERLGRAVPPPMMAAVARELATLLATGPPGGGAPAAPTRRSRARSTSG